MTFWQEGLLMNLLEVLMMAILAYIYEPRYTLKVIRIHL